MSMFFFANTQVMPILSLKSLMVFFPPTILHAFVPFWTYFKCYNHGPLFFCTTQPVVSWHCFYLGISAYVSTTAITSRIVLASLKGTKTRNRHVSGAFFRSFLTTQGLDWFLFRLMVDIDSLNYMVIAMMITMMITMVILFDKYPQVRPFYQIQPLQPRQFSIPA